MFRNEIYITINGEPTSLTGALVFKPLSDVLRYSRQKTGTKVVCAEGDCGACTVMVAKAHEGVFRSVNSCILPTYALDGCHIVTVEGLSSVGQPSPCAGSSENECATSCELHEVQSSMVRNFGGQCGFCTPGFVMSIVNMYESKLSGENPSAVTERNAKNFLTGNLCRCTGYQPILAAATDVDIKKYQKLSTLYPLKKESENLIEKTKSSVLIESADHEFFAPLTIDEAIKYKLKRPTVRIIAGATDIGVQTNKGKDPGQYQMSLHLIRELYEIQKNKTEVKIGARATLIQIEKTLENEFPVLSEFLHIFASPQIKNTATLVGNIANASPIGDTSPFLMALDASIYMTGPKGERKIKLTEFFKAYKVTDVAVDEIITAVSIPLLKNSEWSVATYKVSQRRDLDISCVNATFMVKFDTKLISDLRIALGGVAATPVRLLKVEKEFIHKVWQDETVENIGEAILNAIHPLSDLRGTSEFRKNVIQSLWQKFVDEKCGGVFVLKAPASLNKQETGD